MKEIAEQTATERERQRRFRALSPAERMAEFGRMQKAWWDELCRSPEKYAEFMARNYKLRAVGPDGVNTSHGPVPPMPRTRGR